MSSRPLYREGVWTCNWSWLPGQPEEEDMWGWEEVSKLGILWLDKPGSRCCKHTWSPSRDIYRYPQFCTLTWKTSVTRGIPMCITAGWGRHMSVIGEQPQLADMYPNTLTLPDHPDVSLDGLIWVNWESKASTPTSKAWGPWFCLGIPRACRTRPL